MSPTLSHRNISVLTELILDFEKETSSQKWLTVRILYSLFFIRQWKENNCCFANITSIENCAM